MDDPFEAWETAYKARGEEARVMIARAIAEAVEASDGTLGSAQAILRARREDFAYPFCLVLHSTQTYEEGVEHYSERVGLSEEEVAAARAGLEDAQRVRLALTLLTTVLDTRCGCHLVMLVSSPSTADDGIVRYPTPDDSWEQSLVLMCELAQTIAVVVSVGHHLLRELAFLREAGLPGRSFLCGASELRSLHPDHREREWELPEGLADLYEFARRQPIALVGWTRGILPRQRQDLDTLHVH